MSGFTQDTIDSCNTCFNCGKIYATEKDYYFSELDVSIDFEGGQLEICDDCVRTIIGEKCRIKKADPRKLRDGINKMVENKIKMLESLGYATKLWYNGRYKDLERRD